MGGPKLHGMSKHQYRFDLRTLQLRDFHHNPVATIPERDRRASARAADGERLEWNQLSLWHGVYGWTLEDGTVAVRYVPAAVAGEYLITVERPVEHEVRAVATGAYLLKTHVADLATLLSGANAVEMRR